ncbi:MAG TPA: GNAT family N-acetyltransferase [Puia sp.]|nr:GNAT family N-acetyltransferase [Puia sp.]
MLDSHFIYRPATNRDSNKIIALVRSVLPEFGLSLSPETSEKDLFDIEQVYAKNGGVFMVVEDSRKEIVGTAALLQLNDHTGKLRKMYVDKNYRGMHLGDALMEAMLQQAAAFGFKTLYLETVHSMTAAIHLYRKYGFEVVDDETAVSPRCDMVMRKEI